MKLATTKCRTTWANMKSTNPLSGEILQNIALFSGFAWSRRQTPKMKQLTLDMNPDRNELKGKVPTRQQ